MFVGERNPKIFIISKDSDWEPLNKPPAIDWSYINHKSVFLAIACSLLLVTEGGGHAARNSNTSKDVQHMYNMNPVLELGLH